MPLSPLAFVLMKAARQKEGFHEQVNLLVGFHTEPLQRLQFNFSRLGGGIILGAGGLGLGILPGHHRCPSTTAIADLPYLATHSLPPVVVAGLRA